MDDLYLVKFGGNALDGDGLKKLCGEIAGLQKEGHKFIIVNGGGPEIDAELRRRSITPKKVAGKRVTDAPTMQVVEDVLTGISKNVAQSLREAGSSKAQQVSAFTFALCYRDSPMKVIDEGKEMTVDFGLTGLPEKVDPEPLLALVKEGAVPVVTPVGADKDGNHLNVNADDMAAAVAAATGAQLLLVTDVPGILRDKDDPSTKIDEVKGSQVDALIRDGTVCGGMVTKVKACVRALEAGVVSVRMVNGKSEGTIVADAVRGKPVGTLITKG